MAVSMAKYAPQHARRRLLTGIGFLVLATVAVITIKFYDSYAEQQMDADYLAFSSEIVRAQHDGDSLRQSTLNLLDHPEALHQRQILQALWVINSRKSAIEQYLQRSNLMQEDLGHIMAEFSHLDTLLRQAQNIAQDVLEHPGETHSLLNLTEDIDDSLAYIYSELHALMILGATEQQHIMSMMTKIIIALGALILVIIFGLLVAIEKILGQQHELEHLSITDELTGLENRRAAMNRAKHILTLAKHSGDSVSLAIIDIDHFKRINDRYGHPFGDQVIKQLALQLKTMARKSDVLARIGGEEFCLLMPNTDPDGASELCERLLRSTRAIIITHEENSIPLTVSIGVTTTRQQDDYDFDALYAHADAALYRAKAGGRDRANSY